MCTTDIWVAAATTRDCHGHVQFWRSALPSNFLARSYALFAMLMVANVRVCSSWLSTPRCKRAPLQPFFAFRQILVAQVVAVSTTTTITSITIICINAICPVASPTSTTVVPGHSVRQFIEKSWTLTPFSILSNRTLLWFKQRQWFFSKLSVKMDTVFNQF